jgi:hypothetical protein
MGPICAALIDATRVLWKEVAPAFGASVAMGLAVGCGTALKGHMSDWGPVIGSTRH